MYGNKMDHTCIQYHKALETTKRNGATCTCITVANPWPRPKPWHQQTPGVGGAYLVQLGPPVDHHVNGLLVVQDCWTGIGGGIPNEILSQGIDLLV